MRRFAPLAGVALLGLSGCLFGKVPQDHFYRLEARSPATALPAPPPLAGSLRVEPVRMDGLTRGTALVYSMADRPAELRRYAYHFWVDSPSEMLRVALSRYLREAGAAENVLNVESRESADYRLLARARRLEQVLEPGGGARVVVELEVAIARPDGQLHFQRDYREERELSGGAPEAAVELGLALDAILARLVSDLASPP